METLVQPATGIQSIEIGETRQRETFPINIFAVTL